MPPVPIGLYTDLSTGQVLMDQDISTGIGIIAWLLSVTFGLHNAWLLLP